MIGDIDGEGKPGDGEGERPAGAVMTQIGFCVLKLANLESASSAGRKKSGWSAMAFGA
jgi:hypothetical protein